LKPTASSTKSPHPPSLASPLHQTTPEKGPIYGIQIKSATKLSQRERKRLSSQNLAAASLASNTSATNSAASTPSAWGTTRATATTSAASSAAKLSLSDIQMQQESQSLQKSFPSASSFTPTKTTKWSVTSNGSFMEKSPLMTSRTSSNCGGEKILFSGHQSTPPSFTTSPVVSLLNIQQQQSQAKLVMQKVKSKTISQIQAEECAIRELSQFYKETRAPDSGEWFTLERKTKL
jgi:hypothetical protein